MRIKYTLLNLTHGTITKEFNSDLIKATYNERTQTTELTFADTSTIGLLTSKEEHEKILDNLFVSSKLVTIEGVCLHHWSYCCEEYTRQFSALVDLLINLKAIPEKGRDSLIKAGHLPYTIKESL
jgi:hypothetical protein